MNRGEPGEGWLAPRLLQMCSSIIWFSSSSVRPLWPCVRLCVSGGGGARGAGCGDGVCTGATGGLHKWKK